MANDVLITGLPRAGTTLVVSLLNRLDDVVALHEPIEFLQAPLERERAYDALIAPFLASTRAQILAARKARARIIAGRDDNPYGDDRNESGLRTSRTRVDWVSIDKPLTPDFLLAVKHPMAFTALVDDLVARLPVYAVVRNPLALLASWASVEAAFNLGRIPVAESLNAEIHQRLAGLDGIVERQLAILDWMFGQYARHLPRDRIIFYEDLVSSRGSALSVVSARAGALDVPLESRNDNTLYDRSAMLGIADRLLSAPGAMWDFYSRADVEALAGRVARGAP
jgi:hypothetical protein